MILDFSDMKEDERDTECLGEWVPVFKLWPETALLRRPYFESTPEAGEELSCADVGGKVDSRQREEQIVKISCRNLPASFGLGRRLVLSQRSGLRKEESQVRTGRW